MNATPGLFDSLARMAPIGKLHRRGHDTEAAAAVAIAPSLTHLREAVMSFLVGRGAAGATDDEGAAATGLHLYTYAPRRNELLNAGLVAKSTMRRPTSRGGTAIVWVARQFLTDSLPQTSILANGRLRADEPSGAVAHPVTCVPSASPTATNRPTPPGCSRGKADSPPC